MNMEETNKNIPEATNFIEQFINEDMENGGYYVQETDAPTGYRMNRNKYEVVLSEDYDFAEDNAIRIVVNDEALPTIVTGVYNSPVAWIGAFIAAIAGMFFVLKRKKAAE